MTILTKPTTGTKQIPKAVTPENVETGAVIEQVHFFSLDTIFMLSFST